ncbi:MAG TPA: hypothetical protein DDZ96_08140 [Porphyromonadaceae bacterium]|jgi:L-lactate dehydrogenase complex protein LldG|nr:hypothetical protein [Porphyromonadaceae bacterium]HBL33773.1 hypothetical protein [Porphyromonadaceae bacterium]HBX19990.1 hypothetical protein [Porphyromonadaceae bacterium]HCM22264.1 hypothetical protein [Porphyromonadaceae bacterium]
MSSKLSILENIRKNIDEQYEMPDLDAFVPTAYADKLSQFIDISKGVGGHARVLEGGEDLNAVISGLYPEAKTIASNLPEVTVATFNPDERDDAHTLIGIDLGVVKGEFGVAENGCVWIPQNVKYKALYFISEYLVIILDKHRIVNTMHEAYNQIDMHGKGFGVFISGPSKTADIEQALVVGAHGPKGVTVLLV